MATEGKWEFSEEIDRTITKFISDKEQRFYIGVDNGATNTRVALGTEFQYIVIERLICRTTDELIAGLHGVAQKLRNLGCLQLIRSGCIGAAGRVFNLGSSVEITNFKEGHRIVHLHELPSELFPPGKSRILNDLEIACYGISGLSASRSLDKHFQLFSGSAPDNLSELANQHYLVLAVGTGLGVGLLMFLNGFHSHLVLPLESGHIQFNSSAWNNPRREEENDMIKSISEKLYGGNQALEYEDLVSGRGLEYIYEWIVSDKPDAPRLDAKEISQRALDGTCEDAKKSLHLHYIYLARASSNLAVGLQAKGIFWAGGNQVTNMQFVLDHKESLLGEFKTHPKREWIEDTPIYIQNDHFEINLEGAFNVCRIILDRPSLS